MSTLEEIIKQIEVKKLKDLYINYVDILNIVSEYIVNKKLLLYGGLAINLLLPKKYQFYKEYTLNDFDCYSNNAYKDIMELSKILKERGVKYIKVRRAIHKETYRIYVNRKQIIDITNIRNSVYQKINKYFNKELPTLKYYKDNYQIIPIMMIKRNFNYELSRPEQSSFRWTKIYNRMKVFNQVYKNKKSKISEQCVPIDKEYHVLIKKILDYIKLNGNPIIDSYALKLYQKLKNKCCCRMSEFSKLLVILSESYIKTKNDIVELIEKNLDKNTFEIIVEKYENEVEIILPRYEISILNKQNNKQIKIIAIILSENECFSVQKINGYTVGSIDTILYFLYSFYTSNSINNESNEENLHLINVYEDYIDNTLNNNLKKRLSNICYGKINLDKDMNTDWKKRLTIRHF